MQMRLLLGCCALHLLAVYAPLHAQHLNGVLSGTPCATLLDSLATKPAIHLGGIGYSGEVTPRGMWLTELIARRAEWWSLDSLGSARVTTCAAVLYALDEQRKDVYAAYAKTAGDTARLFTMSGCTGEEERIADIAFGRLSRYFPKAHGPYGELDDSAGSFVDSLHEQTDRLASYAALQRIVDRGATDTAALARRLVSIYRATDAVAPLLLLTELGTAADVPLMRERLGRKNMQAMTEALWAFDAARHAELLELVQPLALELAPRYGEWAVQEFFEAYDGVLDRVPGSIGEPLRATLERRKP